MDMASLYQEIILDHFKNPRHRGLREAADGVRTAEVHHVNPTCGDEVTVRVALAPPVGDDPDPVVADVSYDGHGCSISQASTSVMTGLVIGRPLSEGLARHDAFLALMQSRGQGAVDPDASEELLEDAIAFEGVSKFPARVKCALLGWMAFKDAAARAVAQAVPAAHTVSQEGPAASAVAQPGEGTDE